MFLFLVFRKKGKEEKNDREEKLGKRITGHVSMRVNVWSVKRELSISKDAFLTGKAWLTRDEYGDFSSVFHFFF